jgi:hypothetical protein
MPPQTARIIEEFKRADDVIMNRANNQLKAGYLTARPPEIKSTESRNA